MSFIRFVDWLLVLSMTATIVGCMSVTESGIEWIFSDPRTKIHAFYIEVRLSFAVKDAHVTTTRTGEVYYLAGVGNSNFPPCDKEIKACWSMTDHYFVTMQNNDVFDIFLNKTNVPITEMETGKQYHLKGHFVSIYRDKATEKGVSWCTILPDFVERQEYGLPARVNGFAPDIDIDATVARLDTNRDQGEITEPDDIYRAFSVDHVSCRHLIHIGGVNTLYR